MRDVFVVMRVCSKLRGRRRLVCDVGARARRSGVLFVRKRCNVFVRRVEDGGMACVR